MHRHESITIKETFLGRGVFSTAPIPAGSFLIEMTGPVIDIEEVPSVAARAVLDYYIQCSETKFFGPSGDYDDIINHSCDPNAGLFFENGKVIIRTTKDIDAGSEIFYDYSTVITNDPFVMKCACGAATCRGEVAAFRTLPKKVRDQYIKLGVVQQYVIDSCNETIKIGERKKRRQLFPLTQSQTANA